MKAAIVTQAGQPPVCASFDAPTPAEGEVLVTVRAAALSQLVRAKASGAHYSFDGGYPFVPGVDGTGVLENGARVYFAFPRAPYGAMAQQVAVPKDHCVALPDGIDDLRAAALANPGMSSWMALKDRARLQPGETVLVNGATGVSGVLAVQIARHLGAGRVIAIGRNPAMLERLKSLGADEAISLTETDDLSARFDACFATGVDVVLDYLWGPSARSLLVAASRAKPAHTRRRFVQIGAMGGGEISLPAGWLRSSAIELMGSGLGSVAMPRVIAAVGEMLAVADKIGLEITTECVPLERVSEAWADTESRARQVITLG
ncbi:quinone oxidoreductase family protein [Celeribacter sp. SCSIO 80788]|uniref:quinone oxidoreductase family protein n=1 Tax=Celeribacter sp. SCSIO 80788 TaxID=3117013 RepID=UPI003DA36A9C